MQAPDRCASHAAAPQPLGGRAHGLISRHTHPLLRRPGDGPHRLRCAVTPVLECKTAREAILSGTEAFKAGRAAQALQLYDRAMALGPDEDEARAALYNAACAHAKLRQWQPAADAVVRAVNEYSLRLNVAVQDDDLRALRERREWLDALEVAKGGVTSAALVRARSETRAPFRLARLFLFGGLSAGAALGLFIIAGRLVAALRGGESAPDLTETLTNFTINSLALALLAWLFQRDLRGQQADSALVEREEGLGRLLVRMGEGREIPLASFRGTARVVILAGSRGFLNRALKAAEPWQRALEARGMALLPLELSAQDSDAALRQLKQQLALEERGGKQKGFGERPKEEPPLQATPVGAGREKWELRPAQEEEWKAWLAQQRASAGVKSTDNYVQVQLNGSVRSSGSGVPPFERWIDDIPPLDDIRTKFGDGLRS